MRKEDCIYYDWTIQKETCDKEDGNPCECVLFNCDYCKDFIDGNKKD